MHTLLSDPLFFRVNRLNIRFWNGEKCGRDNLGDYIGDMYSVEVDSNRIRNNYNKLKLFHELKENDRITLSNYDLLFLVFKSFKGSYMLLFAFKLLSLILTGFLAFSLKRFQDSFGRGSEYVKGVILIINQIIEVTFNIYADYFTELLHIRVRGALTLFVITQMLRNGNFDLNNAENESIEYDLEKKPFKDTTNFAKIQNVIAVDGEFTEYMISYGMELILFPFNLFFIFSLTNIFIERTPIWICIVILAALGMIAITSQYISSYNKKHFMDARDERIACLTKSVSENDDYLLTHMFYSFYMNIVKKFRGVEMKYNKYRKYWFCLGEVMSYWMEMSCTISICLYCYFNKYSNLEVSSILTNCSFVIPTLVRPISSIAYFIYYLTEAVNALTRLKNALNNYSNDSLIYLEKQDKDKYFFDTVEDIEQICIQSFRGNNNSDISEIVLRKGYINIILDSEMHKDEPGMVSKMFKELLFSNSNVEEDCETLERGGFKILANIRNKQVFVPNLRCITKNIYYINQKSWLFESDTVRNTILCDKPFNDSLWNIAISVSQLKFDIENGSINIKENINVKQISHGQRIRISLARTIYNSFFNCEFNGRKQPCIYLIENIFDYLDKTTSFRLLHALFGRNELLFGPFNSGFGFIAVRPEMLELFVYSIYYDTCLNSVNLAVSGLSKDMENCIQIIDLNGSISVSYENVNVLLSKKSSSYYKIVHDSLNEKNTPKSSSLVNLGAIEFKDTYNLHSIAKHSATELLFTDHDDNKDQDFNYDYKEKDDKKKDYHSNSNEDKPFIVKTRSELDISKEIDAFYDLSYKKMVTSSLFYYLFQTNDKIRYKYNVKMSKAINIKRNKTMISVYLLLSILPVLLFKILEYLILKYMQYSANISNYLLRYVSLTAIVLVNYLVTIFLEISIGLKSANYIHNTILYSYLTNSSIARIIPVSSIIGHLSNDQLVIDYCITKRIGQVINHLNKILAFTIISILTNSNKPLLYLPITLLYFAFIYWNYISYFISSCRMLRLMYLTGLTSLTDVAHSINYGSHEIITGNIGLYIESHCVKKAAAMLAPLYGQNVIFTWLRLRIDFLLPILLTSMNVLTPIFVSRVGMERFVSVNMFIYVIGIGLTIPKITSSTSKYWVKMENELLAVTRMRLLLNFLKDDKFGKNLIVVKKRDFSSVLDLCNVESRYYKLSNDPFFIKDDDRKKLEYSICLKNLSLKIRKGDVIGVIGRTGSGKTTLLKLLGGILETSSGTKTIYTDESDYINLNGISNRNGIYRMRESSLRMLRAILKVSDIDPDVVLNSIKMLELLSSVAYLPVRVDFPCNITLREIVDPDAEHSTQMIISTLCLFGLVGTDEGKTINKNCQTVLTVETQNKHENLLQSPISYFKFNKVQLRFLILVKFLLNSCKYKLVLIDEFPNHSLIYNGKRYSVIDFIVKEYFSDSCVIVATHRIENISAINRIFLVKNDHSVCEIEKK
ncbi:hypothetical protein FG386_001294 [Cryptosporidium ryanae]|uniref:uncharacterized protein n=1 Tax=Cryptosporidium ryanae TaxID=515981 RepID=UPI00351A493A|nr:hypothetical protein FG386_001294 [Cryptosporidium ryanae]